MDMGKIDEAIEAVADEIKKEADNGTIKGEAVSALASLLQARTLAESTNTLSKGYHR